jgi:hypothetical protein
LVFDTDPLKIGRRSSLCHTKVRCYQRQTERDHQADHGFHDKPLFDLSLNAACCLTRVMRKIKVLSLAVWKFVFSVSMPEKFLL